MNSHKTCPAVRVVMFPADCNPSGNIFGGIILSHIDIAGAIAAKQLTVHRVVTVSMDAVVFKRPVLVGDILTCWTEVLKKGRTSIKVKITVEVERQGKVIHVTEGTATYVAVDANHRSIPWDSPAGTLAEVSGDNSEADADAAAPDASVDSDADADAGEGCLPCRGGPSSVENTEKKDKKKNKKGKKKGKNKKGKKK